MVFLILTSLRHCGSQSRDKYNPTSPFRRDFCKNVELWCPCIRHSEDATFFTSLQVTQAVTKLSAYRKTPLPPQMLSPQPSALRAHRLHPRPAHISLLKHPFLMEKASGLLNWMTNKNCSNIYTVSKAAQCTLIDNPHPHAATWVSPISPEIPQLPMSW